MDTGQAVLLGIVLLGLIQEVKTLVWGSNKDRATVAIVNGCALAATFLVAETVWGNEQIIGGQQLGLLDWASKLVVALVLGGVAAGGWETITSVRNIGQNQLTRRQAAAMDVSAEVSAERLMRASEPDAGGSHPHADIPIPESAFRDQ